MVSTKEKKAYLLLLALELLIKVYFRFYKPSIFFVRLLGLANKVVIIDEVHAYDTYMSTLLNRLLEWLSVIGASVILLSATLPQKKRLEMIKAYLGKSYENDSLSKIEYPRIQFISNDKIYSPIHIEPNKDIVKRPNINIKWIDKSNLYSKLLDLTSEGGCTAIICNTINRAQELFTEIKSNDNFKDYEIFLIHSRFPYQNRMNLEKRIIDYFGKQDKNKKSSRPHRAILVSTQIIEQSLDIDFDLMFTDIAPIDLVLQRSGRLFRHLNENKDYRYSKIENPNLYILEPNFCENDRKEFTDNKEIKEELCKKIEKDSCVPYNEYIINRSYHVLKKYETVILPDSIEEMIESVYNDEDLTCIDKDTKAILDELQAKYINDIKKDKSKAKFVQIASPRYDDDILEQENLKLKEEDEIKNHESFSASTRLIDVSLPVICLFETDIEKQYSLCYDKNDIIDFNNEIDEQDTIKLLKCSLNITNKGLFYKLLEHKELQPNILKKNSNLNTHRILVFSKNNELEIDSYRLIFDEIKGLIIEKI